MAEIKREEFEEEKERREYRRRRRIRNQIIAYIFAVIMLAALIAGAVFGIHKLVTALNDKKQERELQEQMEEMLNSPEDPGTVEAPAVSMEEAVEDEKSDLDKIVDACIAEIPLEDKVKGLFLITPEALTDTGVVVQAGDTTREKLSEWAVGGLIYSEQNMKSAEQLQEMLSNTRGWSKYPLFIGVEEEGGSISPVAKSGLAENQGNMSEAAASGDTAVVKEKASAISEYLSTYGFNLDFAPVANVSSEGNTISAERSFGSNAGEAANMLAAAVEGLQEGGVSACLKYFPGTGSAAEDTNAGMAVSEKTLEEFQTEDFLTFQAGIHAGADFVMVSHLSLPNITGDNTPASLSDKMITEILRGELGFEGVVITDAMNQAAVTDYYTSGEAAVKALQAGADMILMPEDFQAAYAGVLEAVNNGVISEDRVNASLQRIYRIKYKNKVEE